MEKLPISDSMSGWHIGDKLLDAEKVLYNKLMKTASSSSLTPIVSFIRFVNNDEIQETLSATKTCSKQAKARIYFLFCLHILKQSI